MKNCIVCANALDNKIATFTNMPAAAQHMPCKEELSGEKGLDLDFYQCSGCGLVQFDCEPVEYYRDVIRAGGISEKMKELRRRQLKRFIESFKLENKKVWEVGCGSGEFLGLVSEFPVEPFGLENNKEFVNNARCKGLNVINGFVEDETYMSPQGPFDAFLSFNFLEHQPNPNGMLKGIYNNLTENGVGLITVPSFEYVQEQDCYYELLRDHIAYYSEKTLSYLVNKNGFDVMEMTRFNGDTIEIWVKKRKIIKFCSLMDEKEIINNKIQAFICKSRNDEKIAVWGASHQAFTLLSTLELGDQIDYVIDSASFKWNYYTPCSHIPIVSPDILNSIEIDKIIIMAPGYSDEIFKTICQIAPNIKQICSVNGKKVITLK